MNNWNYRKDLLSNRAFFASSDFWCNYIIEILNNGKYQIWDIRKYSDRWDPAFYCYGRVGKELKSLKYAKTKIKALKAY